MSARAEHIGDRFMRQTQAIDAISKPFSPEALLAVVAHALGHKERPLAEPTLVRGEMESQPSLPPPPVESFAGLLDDDDDEDEEDRDKRHHAPPVTSNADPDEFTQEGTVADARLGQTSRDLDASVQEGLARAAAVDRFVTLVREAALPALERAASEGRVDRDEIARVISGAMGADVLGALATAAADMNAHERNAIALEGDVQRVPLGEVLQMLRLQQQTGRFSVRRRGAEVTVAFRDGHIDVALAHGVSGEFLLGRYLIAAGSVTREALDRVLASRTPGAGWLGEQLQRDGVITPDDLERALVRQTSEIIYEMLRWPDGRFRFEPGVLAPQAQGARLGLPVGSLVLERFRRVDEWRVIEQEVRSFDDVLARDEAVIETVGVDRLSREERTVLDAIDGRRTIREVIVAAAMNSFDACKVLYRLLRSKILRRRTA